jgi:hypothetical protein
LGSFYVEEIPLSFSPLGSSPPFPQYLSSTSSYIPCETTQTASTWRSPPSRSSSLPLLTLFFLLLSSSYLALHRIKLSIIYPHQPNITDGKYVEESPESLLLSSPAFFHDFSLIVASQMTEPALLRLDALCRQQVKVHHRPLERIAPYVFRMNG